MKQNRYIPYGYTMRNGKLVIEKTEAEVIRRIFTAYIDGASLKEIAEMLTNEKVPYTEKKTDWFKGRIGRILENVKYCGDSEYDQIIDDEVFEEAITAKAARQTAVPGDLDCEINAVKNRVRCLECGSLMTRKVDKRCLIRAEWSCTNPNCGCRLRVDDASLLERVMLLISRVKANERLLDQPPKGQSENASIRKHENELEQELNRKHPDEDIILEHIMNLATEEYETTTAEKELLCERIKKTIRRIEIKEGFDKETFDLIVRTILLGKDQIKIITKTDTTIEERSETDGSTENQQESHGNRTEADTSGR